MSHGTVLELRATIVTYYSVLPDHRPYDNLARILQLITIDPPGKKPIDRLPLISFQVIHFVTSKRMVLLSSRNFERYRKIRVDNDAGSTAIF